MPPSLASCIIFFPFCALRLRVCRVPPALLWWCRKQQQQATHRRPTTFWQCGWGGWRMASQAQQLLECIEKAASTSELASAFESFQQAVDYCTVTVSKADVLSACKSKQVWQAGMEYSTVTSPGQRPPLSIYIVNFLSTSFPTIYCFSPRWGVLTRESSQHVQCQRIALISGSLTEWCVEG